ncbi:MAG TPA: PfkB family carbohydrate kinase [Streptosporangiaceae bacterium]|nr:PfkB family carbohydrate kinase [Streptosporangiaceae bacterium]
MTELFPGPGPAICLLGDAHLDVVVQLSGPVAEETDTPARTVVGVGGQAANVAAWIAGLGGRARLIAAQAGDPPARLVSDELARRGVDLRGPVLDGRTGVVVSLSDGGRSRSMLTDRGVGPRLDRDDLDPRWLDGCGWLHLPAYSLVSSPVRGAALAAAERLPHRSLDLSSTAAVQDYGVDEFRDLAARLRPDVVFGTEAEADLVGPIPGAQTVVKLGARGVRTGGRIYPAWPAEPVDSTGAGDAFAAGYLVGGIELGLQAAARAVSKMGAMP